MAVWNPIAVRIVLNQLLAATPIVNVFHTQTAGPSPAPGELASIAQQAFNAWGTNIIPLLHEDMTLRSAQAYSLAGPDAPTAFYEPGTFPTGQVAGDALPPQAAQVVTWRTEGRGRSARGRTYISGWSETSSNGSQLVPGSQVALAAAVDAFFATMGEETSGLFVYSQQTGGADRAVGLLTPITLGELRNYVFGSQRDRNQRP